MTVTSVGCEKTGAKVQFCPLQFEVCASASATVLPTRDTLHFRNLSNRSPFLANYNYNYNYYNYYKYNTTTQKSPFSTINGTVISENRENGAFATNTNTLQLHTVNNG